MKAAFGGHLGEEMKEKASQWAKETHNIKELPEHVKKKALSEAAKKLRA